MLIIPTTLPPLKGPRQKSAECSITTFPRRIRWTNRQATTLGSFYHISTINSIFPAKIARSMIAILVGVCANKCFLYAGINIPLGRCVVFARGAFCCKPRSVLPKNLAVRFFCLLLSRCFSKSFAISLPTGRGYNAPRVRGWWRWCL